MLVTQDPKRPFFADKRNSRMSSGPLEPFRLRRARTIYLLRNHSHTTIISLLFGSKAEEIQRVISARK